MTATTITPATAPVSSWSATRILVALTAAGIAVNLAIEVALVFLRPESRGDFATNVSAVAVMSLVGLAITWGLVRLGQREGLRTGIAWGLTLLALPAIAVVYFLALPTTLAAGGYVLARHGAGSLRAARVVAIVGIVASLVVSIAMLFIYL